MSRRALGSAALGTALAAAVVQSAQADPCKAIPDRGPLSAYLAPGARFAGPVTYVGDGDSLCVGVGPGPQDWVEVRLADFYAPELQAPGGEGAKRALVGLAMGRRVSCIAEHRTHDRIAAQCRLNGRRLGDLLRAAGVEEGGRGWR